MKFTDQELFDLHIGEALSVDMYFTDRLFTQVVDADEHDLDFIYGEIRRLLGERVADYEDDPESVWSKVPWHARINIDEAVGYLVEILPEYHPVRVGWEKKQR